MNDMNGLDRLAVIVLNYNSGDDTRRCVDRILSFDLGCWMIIVDNCSTDDSYSRLMDAYGANDEVDVLQTGSNGGYGAGNNFGIRYAIDKYSADMVAIVNPDVYFPDGDIIPVMADRLRSKDEYGIIGARIVGRDGDCSPAWSTWSIPTVTELADHLFLQPRRYSKKPERNEVSPGLLKVGCVTGCFFLASVKCLSDIGFFDENIFLYYEETSLGIRCRDKGYITLFAEDLCYYHDHHLPDNKSMTLKQKISLTRDQYNSARYLCKKYYPRIGLFLLWTVEQANRFLLFVSYIKYKIGSGKKR
ncbi:Glycosyltransferase, GT2 family [Lachnospiraceae bacterium XBB2008]|nr:Glycosyltransferase, GT2 family [Lachnospiraceae bacterium XBB2008]